MISRTTQTVLVVLCQFVGLASSVACRKVEGRISEQASRSARPIPGQSKKIEVLFRGVVALTKPTGSSKVYAVVPADRGGRPSSNPKHPIPEHHTFIRFRTDQVDVSRIRGASVKKAGGNSDLGYVLLDNQQLSLEGAEPDPLTYDRDNLVDPSDPHQDTAYYWVTKMGRICPKRDYKSPTGAGIATLIEIEHGVLGGATPEGVWSFAPGSDGTGFVSAVAQAVSWRLTSKLDTFSLRLSKSGELRIKAGGDPIEIGNYPLDDVLGKAMHDPQPGDIDYHFELYDAFFETPHPSGKFHLPKLMRKLSKRTILNSGGPSCGPGSLP